MNTSSLPLAQGTVQLSAQGALRRLLEVLGNAFAVSTGHSALDCVQAPEALKYPMSRRAQRLVHCAQLSAW